jgi:uncharacterized protein YndB with AHSA1/START domain
VERKTDVSDAAVRKATGWGWDDWFALLDAAGARDWSHKKIVAWLAANAELSGWWRQSVAVAFEKAAGKRVLGETADAGFQVGVRTTVAAPLEAVWHALVSPTGKARWLLSETAELVPGAAYEAPDGTEGEIRVVKPLDRIRFTYRRPVAAAASTVQIALVRSGQAKTAITFHHEKLRDPDERELMRRHWKDVAERIKEAAHENRMGDA